MSGMFHVTEVNGLLLSLSFWLHTHVHTTFCLILCVAEKASVMTKKQRQLFSLTDLLELFKPTVLLYYDAA